MKSAADRHSSDRYVPGDTKWDQYVESLYTCTCNPGRPISIATALSLPCSIQLHPALSYSLLGSDALSAKLHGVTSQDRNLNTDHLAKLHTNTLDLTPAPTSSRNSIRIFSSMSVLNPTNSTVGNFRLSNDFASKFCCSTAVRTGLNASVSLSRNIASWVASSIFRECPVR